MASRLFLWVYGVGLLLVEFRDYSTRMVRTKWCPATGIFILELWLIALLQEFKVPLLLFYTSNIALWLIAAGTIATAKGRFGLQH